MLKQDMIDRMYYTLYITDYNNYYEKGYHEFKVQKEDYERDWETICNEIKTTRITGLNGAIMQLWLQDNGIPFLYAGYEDEERFKNGFKRTKILDEATMTFTGHSATLMKIVPHKNIGNY